MIAPRCEPPPDLCCKEAWHWLRDRHGYLRALAWIPTIINDAGDRLGWVTGDGSPAAMGARGYVYVTRCLSPPEVEDMDRRHVGMVSSLASAAAIFEEYATLHAAKNTPEGDRKSASNAAYAAAMRAAITGRKPT